MHDIARDSERNKQAMTITNPRHEADEINDMTPEFFIIAGISLAATFLSAGGNPDMLAIPGAMLAAVIVLLKAQQERRDWKDRAIATLGTSFVGSTGPGAAMHYFWPESFHTMRWTGWSLLGFFGGIIGWMFGYALIRVLDYRKERMIEKAVDEAERRLGIKSDEKEE